MTPTPISHADDTAETRRGSEYRESAGMLENSNFRVTDGLAGSSAGCDGEERVR